MKILTANRLSDGAAVWLCADHSWCTSPQNAIVARDAATEEKLEWAGRAAFAKNEVVDVNLIEVDLVDGQIRPRRLRERIRIGGPTVGSSIGRPARPGVGVAA